MNFKFIRSAAITAAILWTHQGFATPQSWMLTTAPFANWVAITCSKDGNTAVAGNSGSICFSTNSGAAWIVATNAPVGDWTCSAISSDGSEMVVGADGGGIQISRDRGATWSAANVPANYWTSLTCSTNGEIIVAAALADKLNNTVPGRLYVSRNFGKAWKAFSSLKRHFWLSVASSADCLNLIALASDGAVYTSKNSGKSWAHAAIANQPWFSVAMSADGNKSVVVANGGPICTSQDKGATWKLATNAPNASWARVASSSDGQQLIAVQWGGSVYISKDSGINWQPMSVPNTFGGSGLWSVASSAEGDKLYAAGDVINGGPIYIFQPVPQLKIISMNNRALILWPSLAVGFELEQSSDPASSNWVNTAVSIQSTNGWNQVIDQTFVNERFYRLKFPTGVAPNTRFPPPPTTIF